MITKDELIEAGYSFYVGDDDLYYKTVWGPNGKSLYTITFSFAGRSAFARYPIVVADLMDNYGEFMELTYHGREDSTIAEVEEFFADKCPKLKV